MNNTFDFNDIFADFILPEPVYSSQDEKKSTNLMQTFTDNTHENLQDEQSQQSILKIAEPQEIKHFWLHDHQDNEESLLEKPLLQSRKDTACSEEICPQKLTKEEIRKRRFNKQQKNETKNIPKNFGKAIVAFIQKHKKLVKKIVDKTKTSTVKQFMDFLQQYKKQISTIADLRQLWVDNPHQSTIRTLSCIFLRKYSLNYIFNSRVCNYISHIKYRQRFLEAIQAPNQFKHIKDF